MAKTKGGKGKKIVLIVLGLLFAAILFFAYGFFGPNTGDLHKGEFVYIPTGSTYADVRQNLKENGFIRDAASFDFLAKRAGYPEKVKAGKYKITRGMSNYDMVRMLRSGRQIPVKLVINKLRTKQDFISMVAANLEADSTSMNKLMADNNYLQQFGLDSNTAMCAVIPDTYEFYWNTAAEKAFAKIAKYYTAYWNKDRRDAAKSKGLSPEQIVTIASIVEEETNRDDEKGNVASVYINRYRTGMKLQADPTVKFAYGDFTIRRVTGVHLQANSPYNTYLNSGLPPGPICTPSKKTLALVLSAPNTKYIYFCAREDFSGYHRFATNYAEHLRNAALYQAALNEKGIK